MTELMWKRIRLAVLLFLSFYSIYISCSKEPIHLEVDSYVMPIISLQYRGSIIIEQDDIFNAKKDFPKLYAGVNSYDDLRGAKLIKIDENHWMSYYFPIYAMACLPIKILLGAMCLNQELTFTLSNSLYLIIALSYLLKCYSDDDTNKIYCALMLFFAPILYYIPYIGAEPFMFAMSIIAYLSWINDKYIRAAFITSVVSGLNPTFLAIGLVMFVEYVWSKYDENKDFYKSTREIKNVMFLACCYIPSLIPFIVNKVLLGTGSRIMKGALNTLQNSMYDSWFDRVKSYLFDLNLGIASISLFVIFFFCASIVFFVINNNRKMIFVWSSIIITICCFSVMIHINSGMFGCARYILWIYPGVVFSICEFCYAIGNGRAIVKKMVLGSCILSSLFTLKYNGLYSYVDFSNVSKYIMDRVPRLYVSFCDSTFYSRANHYDGGYGNEGFAIYCDQETSEVRKILLKGTKKNQDSLLAMLDSENDSDLAFFKKKFKSNMKDKRYYISIDRTEENQYVLSDIYRTNVIDVVSMIYKSCYGYQMNTADAEMVSKKILNRDNEGYLEIEKWIKTLDYNREEYITFLYTNILGRMPSNDDIKYWISDKQNNELVRAFFESKEFCHIHNMYDYFIGKMVNDIYFECNKKKLSIRESNQIVSQLQKNRKCTYKQIGEWISKLDLSNEEFVNYLYSVILERHASDEELSMWVDKLSLGKMRESVIRDFFTSDEFCDKYGIK